MCEEGLACLKLGHGIRIWSYLVQGRRDLVHLLVRGLRWARNRVGRSRDIGLLGKVVGLLLWLSLNSRLSALPAPRGEGGLLLKFRNNSEMHIFSGARVAGSEAHLCREDDRGEKLEVVLVVQGAGGVFVQLHQLCIYLQEVHSWVNWRCKDPPQ